MLSPKMMGNSDENARCFCGPISGQPATDYAFVERPGQLALSEMPKFHD